MCAAFNALRMYALNAPGSENVDKWRPRAHEFKVHAHEHHHNNTRAPARAGLQHQPVQLRVLRARVVVW